jgi:hypothetical protein
MNRPSRRQRRTLAVLARIGAGLAGAALLAALALPLLVRGPVARWAFSRAFRTMCGTIALANARVGWAAAVNLALGRPVSLVIDDLRIAGPDGQVVLAAARVEAAVAFHRGGAIEVTRLRIAHGRWRLDLDSDGLGTADAFRAVPLAGRAACLDRHAPRAAGPRGGGAGSLALRRVELSDLDTELTFDSWGMTLDGASAVGSLAVGGGGPVLLFEVDGVTARGGSVRIGGPRSPWRTRVPFDDVGIRRVGVFGDAPTDLTLEVDHGTTGAARLTGQARFHNIFLAPGGRRPPGPPGLTADARWTNFGAALQRLEASWRPHGAWSRHLGGDLRARVEGPFRAMEGTLQIQAARTQVTARLAGGRADLQLALDGFDTTWMLDPALRPLLGGALSGRFHATARLAPTFAGLEAEIPDADLRLDRRRAPRGPRRYELRIGTAARGGAGAETLRASIGRVRLAGGVLQLSRERIDWPGLTASLDAEVAFPVQAGPGPRARSRVDVRGDVSVAALEDWIPGGIVSGPLRVDASARGTLERVDLQVGFPPPGAVTVLGQRFLLPRRIDAVAGQDLRLSPFRLRRAAGGTIRVGGRIGRDDRLALAVGVRDLPVAGLPGLDRAGLPRLGGILGADLSVTGSSRRPLLTGKLNVGGLEIARRRIGDLAANLRIAGGAGEITARVDPGLSLHARARRGSGLSIDAEIEARDRPLGVWLPPPLAGAPLQATGRLALAYRWGAPITGDADLTVAGPGLAGVRLQAHVQGVDASAHLAGAVDVARWPQLWPRRVKSAAGVLNLDLALKDALVRPRAVGTLQVARDLIVRAGAWPAAVALAAGGRFDLDGDALTVHDVALATAGATARLDGRATLDFADLERTGLALDLRGEIDPGRFPIRLPDGVSVGGRATVQARVGGLVAARPGPRLDGQVRLAGLTVRLSPSSPVVRGDGVVEAHGDRVETTGVDVQVQGVGAVRVGKPGEPAAARVVSLSPFRIGRVDVPFWGTNLKLGSPGSTFYLPDLDAALRLSGDARGELTLGGEVSVSGGVLAPSRSSRPAPRRGGGKPRAAGAWWRALPPRLTLNLDLLAVDKGIRVEVPVLPDVTVDLRCHLLASNRGATWSGRLHGAGAYGRAAVTLYDWLRPEDLRGCQLTH